MIADEIGRAMPLLEAFVRDGGLLLRGKTEIADLDIKYLVEHPESFTPLPALKWGFRAKWCGLEYEIKGFSSEEEMKQSQMWLSYTAHNCGDTLSTFCYRD